MSEESPECQQVVLSPPHDICTVKNCIRDAFAPEGGGVPVAEEQLAALGIKDVTFYPSPDAVLVVAGRANILVELF